MTFDATLFDQFLRSPPPSPPPTPHDIAALWNQPASIDAEPRLACGSLEVCSKTPNSLESQETLLNEELRSRDDACQSNSRLRIRLRVSQSKITLRLKRPETGHALQSEKKGSKNKQKRWTRIDRPEHRGAAKKGKL